MEVGNPRVRVYDVQSRFRSYAWAGLCFAALSLPALLGTMGRDNVGYLPPRDQMEAGPHWHATIDCKHIVDDSFPHHVEALMDELKWELLTEVQGRLEA